MRLSQIITEVALSPAQLAKRDNWETFIRKVEEEEPFQLVPNKESPEPEYVYIGYEDEEKHEAFVDSLRSGEMFDRLNAMRDSRKTVYLPTTDGDIIKLSDLQKTEEFGRRGGKAETERQESGLVDAINNAVAENKQSPITLKTDGATIENVISANKVEGTSDLGKEPYADIAIHTKGGKTYLLSAKGPTAPSIAGGGIAGLFNIDPNIVGNALKKALNFYKSAFGSSEGKRFPAKKAVEVYIKIPEKYLNPILKGTKEMGGPIDYMYIGPMIVESDFKDSTLTVSGSLIDIDDYMRETGNLFLRIRRRRQTQVLDFTSVDKFGFPNIFYKQGEGGRRIVIVSEKNLPKSLKKKEDDLYIGLGE